jgi:hypothetical protein
MHATAMIPAEHAIVSFKILNDRASFAPGAVADMLRGLVNDRALGLPARSDLDARGIICGPPARC